MLRKAGPGRRPIHKEAKSKQIFLRLTPTGLRGLDAQVEWLQQRGKHDINRSELIERFSRLEPEKLLLLFGEDNSHPGETQTHTKAS